MARRATVTPTELVVNYFLNGDLLAVEQSLVIASAIVKNRREKETSVALTAPRQRRARRASQPQTQETAVVKQGESPGVVEPTANTPVGGAAIATGVGTTATAPAAAPRQRRRRTAAAAGPVAAAGDAPKRTRRRRGTTGATPAMGTGTTASRPTLVNPPPLPDQGDEPISVADGD